EDDSDSYNASRAAEIVDHAEVDGVEGFLSAMGGKWTTSRHLAEKVVDSATKKLGRQPKCSTADVPLYGGATGRFLPFTDKAIASHADIPADIIRNLTRYHGARYEEVLATANERQGEAPELLQPLSATTHDIGAQIVHAVRHEMAVTLEDALLRRTGLGTLVHPGNEALERVADLMARELGWDDAERTRQIEKVEASYKTLDGAA
ncbi:MAG: hypothetical protein CMI60_01180, partial [Parvibaculum sp.]|nr:hypothetical protein [Parvibaculum sp.]